MSSDNSSTTVTAVEKEKSNNNAPIDISNSNNTTTTKRKRNKGVFTFKNYSIHQEHSGQKVGTDALLVVGYTSIAKFKPSNIKNNDTANNRLNDLVWSNKTYDYNIGINNIKQHVDEEGEQWPREILDIGTGSGVLSIMLADRFKHSLVNSIDIDDSAIKQASINVDNIYQEQQDKINSNGTEVDDKWAKNIYLFHTPIQQFDPFNTPTVELKKNKLVIEEKQKGADSSNNTSIGPVPKDGKYDLIISAPPYFPTDMKIDHFVSNMPTNRRIARHTHTLTMDELVANVKRLLRSEESIFNTIVSVPHPSQELEEAAKKHGFHCLERIDVTDCPGSKIIRKMYTFKLNPNHKQEEEEEVKEEVEKKDQKEEIKVEVKEEEKKEIINADEETVKVEVKEEEKKENNNNNNNNETSNGVNNNSLPETIVRTMSIYETSQKDSTLINHRKHSDAYKWMLSDFCNHFLKEKDLEKKRHNPDSSSSSEQGSTSTSSSTSSEGNNHTASDIKQENNDNDEQQLKKQKSDN